MTTTRTQRRQQLLTSLQQLRDKWIQEHPYCTAGQVTFLGNIVRINYYDYKQQKQWEVDLVVPPTTPTKG